nr:immunoglobulin heavy chain junction region [Macaca mulatta]
CATDAYGGGIDYW